MLPFTRVVFPLNALENAIIAAVHAKGASKEVNKAYLEFIKANFIMPIDATADPAAPPMPLFSVDNDRIFLPVFSQQPIFDDWAEDIKDEIHLYRLSGVDLLKGIGDEVHLCLNINSASYKLFLPGEIARMRSMVLKFFS